MTRWSGCADSDRLQSGQAIGLAIGATESVGGMVTQQWMLSLASSGIHIDAVQLTARDTA